MDKIRIITKLTKLDGASLRRRSAIKIPSLTLRIFLREMIASFFDSLHRIPVDSERRCAKFFALARVIDEVGGGGGEGDNDYGAGEGDTFNVDENG